MLREDRGGWYAIEPPPGRYSWVNQEHVDRRSERQGIINVDTWSIIGSEFDIAKYIPVRRKLSKRETVEILEESVVKNPRGPVKMYKIKPTRGEFRYILIKDVALGSGGDKDDFLASNKSDDSRDASSKMVSLDDNKPVGSLLPTTDEEGIATPKVETPNAAALPDNKLPDDAKETPVADSADLPPGTIDANVRLKQIDDEFREMVQKPASQWNLGRIRDQYDELKSSIDDAAFRRDVDKRLANVKRHQANHDEYLAVQQIMRETEARDEQIRQQFLQGRQSVSLQAPVSTQITGTNPAPTTADPFATPQPTPQPLRPNQSNQMFQQPTPWPGRPQTQAQPQWNATQPGNQRPSTVRPQQPAWSASPQTSAPLWPNWTGTPMASRKYDGAGIVQRSALSSPGWPQYVLLAPDGRVLSYLQAGPGVNLERYVGQSMGLVGPRNFRPDLNADLLVVRQAAPVKLSPK